VDPFSTPQHGPASTARRRFLRRGVLFGATLAAATRPTLGAAQSAADDPSRIVGAPLTLYGGRARFEKAAKVKVPPDMPDEWGASLTPLDETLGIITPSALHFEVSRGGIPEIDPGGHRLLIHGMVDRPVVLTLEEIRRLPSISRIVFLECSGNSQWGLRAAPTVQFTHGLTSCAEWTGVPLSLLLREAGIQKGATWIIAEGGDATGNERSIPMAKAMDDVLVAYGQNGEPLRPGNGYPLRLIVPGWEGNLNVKWVRRIKAVDRPYMTRMESTGHSVLLADGKARQLNFVMEAKSVITSPSGGQSLPGPGRHEIRGLAWSGRGLVRRVQVSTDGGRSWRDANLQAPVQRMAHVRFRLDWTWDGREAILQSRCIDDTGYVQPTTAELVKARGRNFVYFNNGIQSWRVAGDGKVHNVPV
jgi:sulfane dehydrogenase subunit SoxC